MTFKGITCDVKNIPVLDPQFIPLGAFNRAFLKTATQPLAIALERNDGLINVFDTFVHGTEVMYDADCYYVERLVKTLLWARGGWHVIVCGSAKIGEYIMQTYSENGSRAFDFHFMARVYEHDFVVEARTYKGKPAQNEISKAVGGHMDGCRIGFDAGGSDRKVSAVVNGECVFSEEVVWHPKLNADPNYHYEGILSAFKSAAEKMPRVDAIGISSAGVYVANHTMIASLFLKVPDDAFKAHVRDIYIRAAKAIGDVPLEVVNDGDVTALAGAISLNDNRILGIAMGTSEAGGYVDGTGNITGWLNELAFVPVDCAPAAMEDEWSGDIGCGVKYFSQDGANKLAAAGGIDIPQGATPAESLKTIQKAAQSGDAYALKIYETLGAYLGHSVCLYAQVYDMRHILLLGRVMSGAGGDLLLSTAKRVLAEEYPELSVNLTLPDEAFRRLGQSVVAASLPEIS